MEAKHLSRLLKPGATKELEDKLKDAVQAVFEKDVPADLDAAAEQLDNLTKLSKAADSLFAKCTARDAMLEQVKMMLSIRGDAAMMQQFLKIAKEFDSQNFNADPLVECSTIRDALQSIAGLQLPSDALWRQWRSSWVL